MSNNNEKFTISLTFSKNTDSEYASIVLLCKDISTFKQARRNRKYNELELNNENIEINYHKFLFIANKVLKFEDSQLTYNKEVIEPEKLHELYLKHSNVEILKSREKIKTEKVENVSEKTSKGKLDELYEELSRTKTTEERKKNIPKVSFDDIGGMEDIIKEIRESVELPLKAPGIFKYLGIKPHKGIMLYGEPGCGKTMIAKAIANEVNAHFVSIKASELMSMWTGQSESNLRKVFEEAKERQPSVIFFDEIDSFARKRNSEETGRYEAKFLTQLLTLIDGVEDYGDICIIAATNRIDILDEALLRSGRFDLKIEIKKPDRKGCLDIFNKLTKKMPLSKSFDKESFSDNLVGLTGADIAFIATEAAYNCMRRNIDIEDILKNSKSVKLGNCKINDDDFKLALDKLRIQ